MARAGALFKVILGLFKGPLMHRCQDSPLVQVFQEVHARSSGGTRREGGVLNLITQNKTSGLVKHRHQHVCVLGEKHIGVKLIFHLYLHLGCTDLILDQYLRQYRVY